jgi:7,8-dihydropterin-6-yl-methyl-4-(beta-D-ribofuranosyl)aminobenzene 5'-phosphate synthase
MKILTLVENTVHRQKLLAEHGLSMLIKTEARTVLFDTGDGQVLLPNAANMDVDLHQVDRIVLSHGHHDHTGGLLKLLEHVGPRKVHAHPGIMQPKFSVRQEDVRSIGLPKARECLEQAGADFQLSEDPVEILPGILSTGRIPRETDFEPVSTFFKSKSGDEMVQDELWDDQSLIVESGDGPVLILGCAHSGLVNTLLHARSLIGGRSFAAVIGGTHLVAADESRLQRTLDELRQFDIGRIAPCHCTGFRAQVALSEAFGERFCLNSVGDSLEFPAR